MTNFKLNYSIYDPIKFSSDSIIKNDVLMFGDIEKNINDLKDSMEYVKAFDLSDIPDELNAKIFEIEDFNLNNCKINEGHINPNEKWYLIRLVNCEFDLNCLNRLYYNNFYLVKYWDDDVLVI